MFFGLFLLNDFLKSFHYTRFLRICTSFSCRDPCLGDHLPASYGGKPITVSSMALAQGEEQKDLVRTYVARSERNAIPCDVAVGSSVEATLVAVVWAAVLQVPTPHMVLHMKISFSILATSVRALLCCLRGVQVVGSESGGIYKTPLHFRNSGVVEVGP